MPIKMETLLNDLREQLCATTESIHTPPKRTEIAHGGLAFTWL